VHAAIAALREIALPPEGDLARTAAFDVAEIVRILDADDDVVIAALLQPLLAGGYLERDGAAKRFGAEPIRLARALDQLGSSACRRAGLRNADWSRRRPRRCARCFWR